jgi:hypothetical protein
MSNAYAVVISKLADLRFEFAVFGHGGAISRDATQRFRELAARL